MRFLLIDHFDSFTHNVSSWLAQKDGYSVDIITYGESFDHKSYDLIILSPGPKAPQNYPLTLNLLKKNQDKPILGICLGMQMMVEQEGGIISPYSPPLHGKTSPLLTQPNSKFFASLNGTKVARYHSLQVGKLPDCFELLALSPDQCPMAILHKKRPYLGLQFHPESFLTEKSTEFWQEIIEWVKSC